VTIRSWTVAADALGAGEYDYRCHAINEIPPDHGGGLLVTHGVGIDISAFSPAHVGLPWCPECEALPENSGLDLSLFRPVTPSPVATPEPEQPRALPEIPPDSSAALSGPPAKPARYADEDDERGWTEIWRQDG
jgi:hypothetical protein